MLAIKIWNYIRGYVIIKVEGLTLERLLNLAASYDIYLWDIKRRNNIILEMKASIRGFKEMKKIVKKVGCRIEIKEKRGFPFIILKFRKRKMLGVGFLLFLISIVMLTSTIWNIEIIGNDITPREEIISLLKDKDISIGKLKYKIDKEYIKDIIIDKYDYISFISPIIKGTKLTIEIKEQDVPPEKVNKDYPCNIIAKKKGVIVKVTSKNGNAVVETGEIVNEGQILISGTLKNEITNKYLLVHSEGEVLALTRYSSSVSEPIVKTEEKLTGAEYSQKGLEIMDKGIRFIKGDVPFINYREEVKKKSLFRFDKLGVEFPIMTIRYIYKEVETREVKQNIDFLKNTTSLQATKEINKELPKDAKIQTKNTIYDIDGNTLTTKVVIETIEDIGKKQIIENVEETKED